MKSFLVSVLAFLKGRKTTIGVILAAINTYLLTIGVYGNNEALLINTILIALGLTANIADNKLSINANQKFGK
jgi:hypothetical protein